MEAVNQMLDPMKAAQLTQSVQERGARQKSGQSTDFDEMLQQKSQEPAPTARPAEKQEVREQDAPRAEESPQTDEELPEDAKAVLAAMMLQPQIQPQIEVQQETAELEEAAAPVALAEAVETVEASPEAAAAAEVPQTTTAQPQQRTDAPARQPQQRTDAPAETTSQPGQVTDETPEAIEAPQAAAEAPETARRPQQGAERQVEATQQRPRQAAEDADERTEAPVETPLFRETGDATPVKVAEPVLNPEKPVPIETEEAPRELADILTRSVEQDNTIGVIRLTPENLGPVTLTLTRGTDGAIHMVLEALNPRTTALLERHAANIQNIAAENTHEDVRVEIRSEQEQMLRDNWTEGRDGQRQSQQQQRPQQESETREDFLHRLRLGLTDDADAS